MKKIKFILFGIISLILVFGCQKETNQLTELKTPNSIDMNQKDHSFVSGRIIFNDSIAFNKHLQWIFENQNQPEIIKKFNIDLGLTSMMSIYENGINIDNEKDFKKYYILHPNAFYPIEVESSVLYELSAPSVFAYIANEDGIYQIGKSIYRITFNHILEIDNGDESKIPILLLPIKDISDNNIIISETHDNSTKGQYSYKTVYFTSTKRIVARLYKNSIGGAYYYEARTTSQRKSFGIWWQRQITQIGVNWNQGYAKYYSWNNPITINAQTNSDSDKANIQRTVFIAHYSVDHSQSSCLAKHYGKDGTTTKQITNNQIFP